MELRHEKFLHYRSIINIVFLKSIVIYFRNIINQFQCTLRK